MLPVTVQRVFLAKYGLDFRKRFDGMLAESYRMGANPYDGDCVVFVKRDHTQLRALVGDAVGLYLICRRFEGGRLKQLMKFAEAPEASHISTAELSLLLKEPPLPCILGPEDGGNRTVSWRFFFHGVKKILPKDLRYDLRMM
jgi:hypothetical protein